MTAAILPWMVAAAVFAAALGLAGVFFGQGPRLQRRAERLARRVAGARVRPDAPARLGLAPEQGWERRLARIVPRPEVLRRRLAAAGTSLSVGRYGLVCVAVGLVALALLSVVAGLPPGAALPGAFACALLLPHAWLGRRIDARREAFLKRFPEALDLMVRGLRSGLPVAETMKEVGREMARPVGEEFQRITDQVRLGATLEQALWKAVERLETAEFKFFVITLSIQRETGGNLGETLANLAEILRKRQQMRLKVKAMSSEARASAGIIAALPFVMFAILALMSPDYVFALFTDPRGTVLLVIGGVMMLIGIVIMAKMVRFAI